MNARVRSYSEYNLNGAAIIQYTVYCDLHTVNSIPSVYYVIKCISLIIGAAVVQSSGGTILY